MGDFAGGLLKYLRRHPVEKLTVAGGFAKIAKLAEGHLDLHSDRSSVDMNTLSAILTELGADAETAKAAERANTALAVLRLAGERSGMLADRIAARARAVALATLAGGTEVTVDIFDRDGRRIGHAGP